MKLYTRFSGRCIKAYKYAYENEATLSTRSSISMIHVAIKLSYTGVRSIQTVVACNYIAKRYK